MKQSVEVEHHTESHERNKDPYIDADLVITEFSKRFPHDVKLRVQEVLVHLGLYRGDLDGKWGQETYSSLVKLFSVLGESGVTYNLSSPSDFIDVVNISISPEGLEHFKR